MTTGRINQVTILTRHGPETGRAPEAHPKANGVITELRGDETPPGGGHPRGHKVARTRPAPIHLPPLSSPRGGPRHVGKAGARSHSTPGATCTPREEDASRPSRPEAVTSFGLPPSVLGIMFAIGQPSTDSSIALRQVEGTSVHPRPARTGTPEGARVERSGGATHHPGWSQRQPPVKGAHAVEKNSAHG